MSEHLIHGISQRLKKIRKSQNLKLTQVAEEAGISKGLLSKIENGRTVPSLPVLLSVIGALGLKLNDFFADMYFHPPSRFVHTKAGEEVPFKKEEESEGFQYKLILSKSYENFTIEAVLLDIAPGAERRKVQVDAIEFKYLLEGQIDYELNEEFISFQKGDTLLFDGRIPHVPHNNTSTTARMLVIYLYYTGTES